MVQNYHNADGSLRKKFYCVIYSNFRFAISALTCWLGGRKGFWPVKTEWWGAGMVVCLQRGADLHMAQLMLLPFTVSGFSKIQIGFTFLVPAHLGSPGQRAVKRVCVCVCVCVCVRHSFVPCCRPSTTRQVLRCRCRPMSYFPPVLTAGWSACWSAARKCGRRRRMLSR